MVAPHVTWYRRYRPRSFTELVGQPAVVRTLTHAIAAGTVSHAYLLAGTRGSGKTTTARLLAMAVNCEAPTRGNPCGACEPCRLIGEDRAQDVLELDAASNTGIDAMRELRQKVPYAPARLRRKVYVLDEVHRLSANAFDAFLKTLEEPPAHVVFVLCTTELDKVPATIQSRCQVFRFEPVRQGPMVAALTRVATAEGVTVDEETLRQIGVAAGGSVRDAIGRLEQLATSGAGVVDAGADAYVPARQSELIAMALIKALAGRNLGTALTLIAKTQAQGYEATLLAQWVTLGLSTLLWLSAGVDHPRGISPDARATYGPLATVVPQRTIARWLRLIAPVCTVREAWDSTLPLELAVVECLIDAV